LIFTDNSNDDSNYSDKDTDIHDQIVQQPLQQPPQQPAGPVQVHKELQLSKGHWAVDQLAVDLFGITTCSKDPVADQALPKMPIEYNKKNEGDSHSGNKLLHGSGGHG